MTELDTLRSSIVADAEQLFGRTVAGMALDVRGRLPGFRKVILNQEQAAHLRKLEQEHGTGNFEPTPSVHGVADAEPDFKLKPCR